MRVLMLLILSLSLASALFDQSGCGKSKSCYIDDTCDYNRLDDCAIGVSYRPLSDEYIEVELFGRVKDTGNDLTEAGYLAVGWSSNTEMSDTLLTECSVLPGAEGTSMKLSHTTTGDKSSAGKIPGEPASRDSVLFNSTARFVNGQLYCSAVQKVKNTAENSNNLFELDSTKKYHLILFTEPAGMNNMEQHSKHASISQAVDVRMVELVRGDPDVARRHRLNKAHAILMCFAWLFFIPSAFLFARFMRGAWPDYKPMGLLIWFHVHRACNLIGLALMVASLVCIGISKKWTWLGWGTDTKYWTLTHTMCGVFSCFLAFLQPFLSTLRCDAGNPRRSIFNWIHRMTGMLSFILATTTIAVAAVHFSIWDEPALQMCLTLTPLVLSLLLTAIFVVIDWKVVVNQLNQKRVHLVRAVIVFAGICILLVVNVWAAVLLANGYKLKH